MGTRQLNTLDRATAKLAELRLQRENAIAQVNALAGAIQVLEQLLKEEPTPETEE